MADDRWHLPMQRFALNVSGLAVHFTLCFWRIHYELFDKIYCLVLFFALIVVSFFFNWH